MLQNHLGVLSVIYERENRKWLSPILDIGKMEIYAVIIFWFKK